MSPAIREGSRYAVMLAPHPAKEDPVAYSVYIHVRRLRLIQESKTEIPKTEKVKIPKIVENRFLQPPLVFLTFFAYTFFTTFSNWRNYMNCGDGSPEAPPKNPTEETIRERLERIEANSATVDRQDVLFMLDLISNLGGQRIRGIREAAGLIRRSQNKEVTTRFLVGKKETAARAMNNKLLDVVAGLIERYAEDAQAGKL